MGILENELAALKRIAEFHKQAAPEMVEFYTWNPRDRSSGYIVRNGYEVTRTYRGARNRSGEIRIYIGVVEAHLIDWDGESGVLRLPPEQQVQVLRYTE